MRRLIPALAVLFAVLLAPVAVATPVATDDDSYGVLGRVFPDPMGGCGQIGSSPCSPNAQGNVPATQFIGYDEFVDGMTFLNSKPEWQRYLEVWPLDGKVGENDGDVAPGATPGEAFPGNTLPAFEFTPRQEFRSVGLATTGTGRAKNDMWVVRVTDENVPDAGKKRYAVSLSIHGIERAGAEGGTRAAEDLVTAFTTGRADQKIVPDGTVRAAPSFADVLRDTIIYFVYPNPDGWRRGSVSQGGVFFQRYNGNGVDLNRDWRDVGFAFRPYSPGSEPETKALESFFQQVASSGPKFAGGVDLHGQLTADALSYTLLGHGRKDWAKDTRVREVAKAIHKVSEKALAWSPLIVPNSTPKSENGCSTAVTGDDTEACARIYGQTWGTVYDTINYTVTGSLGDWMDSPIGLDTDGIDNEMSFSHLDRNIVFEPQGEQLHVDGNKALIYAQVAELLNPPSAPYGAPGRKGYLASPRLKREERNLQPDIPPGSVAQDDISGQSGSFDGSVVFPFEVKAGNQPDGKNIFNGGLRVDITKLNFQGIGDGNAVTTLKVQCKGCDDHPGIDPDSDGFITVAEDYNQSPGYAQAALTAAVNRPATVNSQNGKVEWRAILESTPPQLIDAGAEMAVDFTQEPATASGDTSGAPAPKETAYDVANTDLFRDLNRSIADRNEQFAATTDPDKLDRFDSIVLSDQLAPSATFRDRLRAWVRGGGNLILTDSAVRELPEFADVDATDVEKRDQYVGQISFLKEAAAASDPEGGSADTVTDPLAVSPVSIKQDGARFNSGLRRQTYEPVPLGFPIQYTNPDEGSVGSDRGTSPAWDVKRDVFEKAGGRTVATGVEGGDTGADNLLDRTSLGEFKYGDGKVRFLGALMPQPTQAFSHDFGIEPYSLTYTGHILLRNMLETPDRTVRSTGPGAPGFQAPSCAGRGGFTSANVTARGRGTRMAFSRRVRERVQVDVFQTSVGRRVIRERLVARYPNRVRSFSWDGRANRRGRRVTDGSYFVRYTMRLPNGALDRRRVTLRRSSGRFSKRPSFYRRESCGLVASYKLARPVFGGRNGRPLGISYRLTRSASVSVTVLRGRRVVARFRTGTRRAGRTYRLAFGSRGRGRGDYRVRLTATRGSQRVTSTLTSRRI